MVYTTCHIHFSRFSPFPLHLCLNSEERSEARHRSSICILSAKRKSTLLLLTPVLAAMRYIKNVILTMFSISWGLWRLTVLTAWKTSTSPCCITCSMHAFAAQYIPHLLRPSLKQIIQSTIFIEQHSSFLFNTLCCYLHSTHFQKYLLSPLFGIFGYSFKSTWLRRL